MKATLTIVTILILTFAAYPQPRSFVTVRDGRLSLDGKPYYFVGTNYWYGSLLGLEKDRRRGIDRLRKELDFLKKNGVTNLRLMAGAEGSGLMNGVMRVGPPLQPELGKFDESALDGLDLVLSEMRKRKMKAVIFLSNNWEWSGGFQQYLIWNGSVSKDWLTQKPTWDELRDITAKFYACGPCRAGYEAQARLIVSRTNKLNRQKYTDDPTIMAWELANEPRPMRPSANEQYKQWITEGAALIRSLDRHHLVTIGHEGRIGTEDIKLYEVIHADPNVGYLTIHIWPKNWGWFSNGKLAEGFPKVAEETAKYITEHIEIAGKLGKPLVIEEFGLPRDGQSLDPSAHTSLRDRYYGQILSYIRPGSQVAGANFWAFGGTARPVVGQIFWRSMDQYMGDPPMEEQGLNSVFDTDVSTWRVIRNAVRRID
jgi:mannan endo-1,4-beta-mannosidase